MTLEMIFTNGKISRSLFINTPCSNTRALHPPEQRLKKGFARLYLRKWVIRYSVAYSSVTILLDGEQVSHEMCRPSILFKIIFLQIVLLSRTLWENTSFTACLFRTIDWHRQWRTAATEMTSSSVLSLNTARSRDL